MSDKIQSRDLRISVIIPTYCREEVLCETIRQLLDQDRPPDEVLIIDQTPAHEPETEHFLQQVVSERKVRLFHHDKPSAGRARNRGIVEATGDILLFLDDDIRIEKDFVAAHLENFSDPGVLAVTGAIWSERGVPLPAIAQVPPLALKQPFGWMDMPYNLAIRTEKILMLAGNSSVRRTTAIAIGGFDENFGRYDYCGDFDFGWRIHLAGGKTLHEPRAGIHHLVAPRGGCRVERVRHAVPEAEELRPKFYFYLKNFPSIYSLVPVSKLLRHHVFNRANAMRPYWLPFSVWRAVIAIAQAARDAWFVGERSLVRESRKVKGHEYQTAL